MRRIAVMALSLLLAACGSRPEWADGRMVWEERPAFREAQDLSRLESRLLAVDNRERASTGAPPMTWDPALAAAAAAYGPELARRGRLVHAPAVERPGRARRRGGKAACRAPPNRLKRSKARGGR